MSRKPVRHAALGLLFAILLGIAAPVPASASDGEAAVSFFSVVWEWIEDLLPASPAPDQPDCAEECSDTGHGSDPNG